MFCWMTSIDMSDIRMYRKGIPCVGIYFSRLFFIGWSGGIFWKQQWNFPQGWCRGVSVRLLRYPAVLESRPDNCYLHCSGFYCRFALVHIDCNLVQFTYTNLSTGGGHGVPICRRHWLIQELSFAVDLFIPTALTRSRYSLDRWR